MRRRRGNWSLPFPGPAASLLAAALAVGPAAHTLAQGDQPQSARQAAAMDMAGEWVSVVTEDWKFRMVTPAKGEYGGIPLNGAGRRAADAWDPGADEAAGDSCKAYGAPSIMRVPGRLRIAWQDEQTLRIETDSGSQTRLFHFDPLAPRGAPTWQGYSQAEWKYAAAVGRAPENPRAASGSLSVRTTNLRAGYLRKNGVPYSENTVLAEYYNLIAAPNGDEWLIVTTAVDDPDYLNRPYVTSANFKKLGAGGGWNPTPCSAN